MKSLLLLLGTLLSLSVSAETQHGDTMPEAGPTITLAAAISEQKQASQKISGQITEVCQKKGCFMVLSDGHQFARVTFKDYGFFVPIDSSSKDAVVYGQLTSKTLNPDQANHYEEDAGREGRYKEPVTEYSIVASSVVIL
ncbi:MAG: DUF4920 domain-containing protein [Pseudomonadales bacterium]|nr:DUF4920 domain-containing protein [Pseudomonadales bacterium]MBO6701803.1 DUF4920 domain-containing protein [Pseudomonadales bacterium]MBO7005506.1 DUF4920 domain-containing protein [Pseudomonadales bacterium]